MNTYFYLLFLINKHSKIQAFLTIATLIFLGKIVKCYFLSYYFSSRKFFSIA